MGSFCGRVGILLGPSWVHIGVVLGLFGVVLGSFWGRLGSVVGPFWDHFGIDCLIPDYKPSGPIAYVGGSRSEFTDWLTP